ncbi:hypothetical protein BN1723_019691, partial [Verticillium longisporum]
QEGCSRR